MDRLREWLSPTRACQSINVYEHAPDANDDQFSKRQLLARELPHTTIALERLTISPNGAPSPTGEPPLLSR